ncbi:hypothetical protein KQI63_15935 [bacterium]|nr:hypothetical protein [bacterium]
MIKDEKRTDLPSYAVLLLMLAVLLRLTLIFSQPFHGTPPEGLPAFNDEASHLNHALLDHQSTLPGVQRMGVRDEGALARGEVEYSQPPLYYWMVAGAMKVIGTGTVSLYLLRLASMILWLAGLHLLFYFAPYRAARMPILIGGALLGAGLIPSTTINNDSLFTLTIGGLYAYATMTREENFSILRLINLALLFAVAIWTKLAALTLAPMVLAIAWVAGPRERRWARVVLVGAVALWATMPLWLQRTLLFGSPLSIEHAASGTLPPFDPELLVKSTFYSLVMPWMELWGHPAVKIGMVAFGFLLVVSLAGLFSRWHDLVDAIRERGASTVTLLWMIGGLGAVAGWLYYAIRFQQSEARLLLPAAPALAVAFGWQFLIYRDNLRKALAILVVIIILLPYLALGVG